MPDSKAPFNLDDMDFGHTIRGHQKGDRVFERFVLQKLLGRGGMGVVWLATDERLGREVALKFAPEAIRYDEIAVEELKEETRKGLNLAHPNIVKIYDFLLDEEHAAISMEFIDGENLGLLRAKQPNKVFEPRHLKLWVTQLLDALEYAHTTAKVIHRDLKPANLMVNRDGDLRVTDFGIARSISDALTRVTMGEGNSTGTLAYMSPQQADGKKPHLADDIYALGSTLYELLTGKPPFYTGNIATQLREEAATKLSQRRVEFDILNAEPLPAEWDQVILSCLEKDPAKRPASVSAIRVGLGLVSSVPAHLAEMPEAQAGLTQAWSPADGGLTQVHAPARPIDAGKVRVQTKTTTQAEPDLSAEKKSRAGLFAGLAFGLMMLGMASGATWWIVQNLSVLSPFLPKEKKIAPKASLTAQVEPAKPTPTPPIQAPVTMPKPPEPVAPPAFTTIQAAIHQAKAGDSVTIPSGIYEEQLKFKDGVKLIAAEAGKVVVQTDGKLGSALLVENCQAGSISGFVFQHTGKDVAEKVSWPVVILKSSSVSLESCTVMAGVGDGALITGAGKPQIVKCVFKNNAKNGLVLESGSSGIVTDSESRKNGENGVEVRMLGTKPGFQRCTFSENGGSGLVVKDGSASSVTDKTTCSNNAEAGLAAAGEGVSLIASGVLSEHNQLGITIQQKATGQVSDCVVRHSREVGLHFDQAASGAEGINNTIEQSKLDGILATGPAGATLTLRGNKSLGNAGHGILIFGAGFQPIVEKNECFTNAQHGILAAEAVSGVIRDNLTRGNHLGSITNQGAAVDLVIDGNVME
jgi:serine/threonine protein kinase